jgi:hypothetical protein
MSKSATSGRGTRADRNGMHRPVVALAALAVALCPSMAMAQQVEAESEVSIDLDGRYDGNVARSSEARAIARGLDQSDFVISPGLTINLVRPIGSSANVSLRGTLGYVFHTNNERLNSERIGLDAGAGFGAGPCQIDALASLQRRQSDLADIGFVPGVPIDAVENTETIQTYGADLTCGTSGLRPTAGIQYQTASNSNDVRERAEFDAIRYTVGVQYVNPAIGEISLYASRRDVDLSSQFVGSRVDGYRVTEYGLRFKRDLGTRIQVSAFVANSELSTRNALVAGNSSLVYGGELTALLGSRLQLQVASSRIVTNSLASDAAYVISRPNSARLTYAINDRIQIDAGASITSRRYSYAFLPVSEVIERETRRVYDAGINYKLGRNWRLRAAGGYDERDANGTLFDYSGSFVSGSIGLTF